MRLQQIAFNAVIALRSICRDFAVFYGLSEMKNFSRSALVGVGALATIGYANAALDTAVTTAITAAQTDLLALFAALTTAGAAIWVARLIYKRFSVR